MPENLSISLLETMQASARQSLNDDVETNNNTAQGGDVTDVADMAKIYNIQAEQSVLGGIIQNNENYNRIADFLLAEHFYEPLHQALFAEIITLNEEGFAPTPLVLQERVKAKHNIEDGYLNSLENKGLLVLNIIDEARIIYNLALLRNLIEVGKETIEEASVSNGTIPASQNIERAEQKLFNLAVNGADSKSYQHVKISVDLAYENLDRAIKNKGQINGVPTGFADMDSLLGGFHNSDLIILAARPSMGKTALALNFALQTAYNFRDTSQNNPSQKKSVGFASLEMSSEQLATRLVSIRTGIQSSDIRVGKIDYETELPKILESTEELHSLPLFIDDTPAQTIAAIRTRARRLKRKHNLGLLIIDYLQLLRGVSKQGEINRVQEITEITMGLKAIAKELNIPVIALSQLSRAVEAREDKRPQLADLRESGSIEQDADMVMFIYREEYYHERKRPDEANQEKLVLWQKKMEQVKNRAEIMISKNRNGGIGTVNLAFNKHTTQFNNYAEGYDY